MDFRSKMKYYKYCEYMKTEFCFLRHDKVARSSTVLLWFFFGVAAKTVSPASSKEEFADKKNGAALCDDTTQITYFLTF